MEEDPRRDLSSTHGDPSILPASTHKKFARSISMSGIIGNRSGQTTIQINGEVPLRVRHGDSPSLGRPTADAQGRHNEIRRRRGSPRRSSISLLWDTGDRLLDALNLSQNLSRQILGVVDSSWVAQAGDCGDRVVANSKEDVSGNQRSFMDRSRTDENRASIVPDDVLFLWNEFWAHGENSLPAMLPLGQDYPLPVGSEQQSPEKNSVPATESLSIKDNQEKLPRSLDYISYMIHLAVFAELGVSTRYLLQKLFGPGLLALTGDQSPLYLDLPANMLGSFLMGWFGVVFKADIRRVSSDHIVVGLTTGCLGSLTTFSGWNQKMLDLSADHKWVFAVGGIMLGMMLVNESIRIGVESAEALRKSLSHRYDEDSRKARCIGPCWRVDSLARQKGVMTIMILVLLALWGLSGTLFWLKFNSDSDDAILWLGLLVGPPGAWVRWFMARLNGQGLGKKGFLKWLPFGTLLANVLAAVLMAALSLINEEVIHKRTGIILKGIQFGFMGCLSTVSTFVAEVYAMRQSGQSGKALAYAATTILLSFGMGTLIYFDLV